MRRLGEFVSTLNVPRVQETHVDIFSPRYVNRLRSSLVRQAHGIRETIGC